MTKPTKVSRSTIYRVTVDGGLPLARGRDLAYIADVVRLHCDKPGSRYVDVRDPAKPQFVACFRAITNDDAPIDFTVTHSGVRMSTEQISVHVPWALALAAQLPTRVVHRTEQ